MRKLLLVLALLGAARPLAAQYARARVWPPGFTAQLALDTINAPIQLDAPYEKVYAATVAAFDDLKIPLDTRDSARGLVGNLALKKSGSMAGSQLSRWFNCGNGMTGPNADTFRIYLSVAALLDHVSATSSRIRISMAGGAQDMQGSAKDAVPCASTGGIESRLLEILRKRIATP